MRKSRSDLLRCPAALRGGAVQRQALGQQTLLEAKPELMGWECTNREHKAVKAQIQKKTTTKKWLKMCFRG